MGEDLAASEGRGRQPVVWLEIQDFLQYFRDNPNPTGIQRTVLEICAEIERLFVPAGTARFCRLERRRHRFEPVAFDTILAAYSKAPRWHRAIDGLIAAIPGSLMQRELGKFRGTLRRWRRRGGELLARIGDLGPGRDIESRLFAPGDVLVCFGAGWMDPHYGAAVAAAKREQGIRFLAVIYDVIPVTHGHWCEPRLRESFRHWLVDTVRNADRVLSISEHTRRELIAFAAGARSSLAPVEVLRLGTGFRRRSSSGPAPGKPAARLPARFVLYVSTLEPRKNHALLLRVWQRLLAGHGAGAVPDLVFAGRFGGPVEALMRDLAATRHLDGKVRIVSSLSDDGLDEAYRRCLLTVYPSLVEGWGLPLAESLSHGKLCVASDRTSLPEVAGDLVDYFDPEDEDATLARIERAIFDDAYRRAREARIAAEYRADSWEDCARTLMHHSELLMRSGPGAAAALPDRGVSHVV
jgi:glycosyltransferase involved in cell wall biosynthesis